MNGDTLNGQSNCARQPNFYQATGNETVMFIYQVKKVCFLDKELSKL